MTNGHFPEWRAKITIPMFGCILNDSRTFMLKVSWSSCNRIVVFLLYCKGGVPIILKFCLWWKDETYWHKLVPMIFKEMTLMACVILWKWLNQHEFSYPCNEWMIRTCIRPLHCITLRGYSQVVTHLLLLHINELLIFLRLAHRERSAQTNHLQMHPNSNVVYLRPYSFSIDHTASKQHFWVNMRLTPHALH